MTWLCDTAKLDVVDDKNHHRQAKERDIFLNGRRNTLAPRQFQLTLIHSDSESAGRQLLSITVKKGESERATGRSWLWPI